MILRIQNGAQAGGLMPGLREVGRTCSAPNNTRPSSDERPDFLDYVADAHKRDGHWLRGLRA